MIKLFLICAFGLAGTTAFLATEAEKWIEQKFDHFNKSDTRTWKMRYVANDEFYAAGGPVFIVVGGRGSLSDSPISITEGHFYDTAREHKAFLFQTEHRFYGKSKPEWDLTTENLKYLDVKQALADLAHFIRSIKFLFPKIKNPKVILAGAYYAGSMVTWFKKLYPDLAVGCWASSAPLLAKLDFKEYKEAVGQSIRLVGGDSCYNRIANGVKEMEKMLAENRFDKLKSAFNICNTSDAISELDVGILFSAVFNLFAETVVRHRNQLIKYDCEKVMQGQNDFEGLSNFFVSSDENLSCNNFRYKNNVAAGKVTTFEDDNHRQWYYQKCNEFGWFTTTTSMQQPLGTKAPLRFYTDFCKDVFGDKFTLEYMERQVNKTNQLFGGLNPQVENVYMTYGQLDPWLQVGIQDINKATIIPMESHMPDLESISDEDSYELKAAKMKFKQLVKDWLKN